MALADEDIEVILKAEVGDEFEQVLSITGIVSTGNNVEDFKTLAMAMGVDPEDLLYALFMADDDIFDEGTWSNLTSGWEEDE